MRRSVRGLGALLLALAPAAARAVEIRIVSPAAGDAIFGTVEVRLEVVPSATAAEVRRIEIYLDGKRVGEASTPPYRLVVDAGQENREHHLEAVAYGAAGPVATAERRTVTLRVDEQIDVRLRQLYVTVEKDGEPAPGLERSDFEIRVDGERQEITAFEGGEVPFTAVVLVDASLSMQGGRLATALDGARAFFGAMASFDEAKLVLFADRTLAETPFTNLAAVLDVGLSGVTARGGTSLNDALYLALKRLEARSGRKVVVLLSDGVDVESVLSLDDVKAALGAKPRALLYWLRLRRDEDGAIGDVRISTAWRDPAGHRHEIEQLGKAVAASGGRIATIDRVEQVKEALAGILRELRGQYVLGYSPRRTADGAPPKVEVRLRRSGYLVRVHQGEPGR